MTNDEVGNRQQEQNNLPARNMSYFVAAPHITSIAPLTIASNSLRGTRARARIAMVWIVADANSASTTGSAVSGNSPFSFARRKQAANALSSSESPSSTMARISGSDTASDAAVITVKQPRGPASPDR